MCRIDCLALFGLFAFLSIWGLIVFEHEQKATDLRNQENIVRMK